MRSSSYVAVVNAELPTPLQQRGGRLVVAMIDMMSSFTLSFFHYLEFGRLFTKVLYRTPLDATSFFPCLIIKPQS